MLVSAADSQPIPYGTVLGPDSTDRFANAAGRFSLGALSQGQYRVRARMLGYAPLDTTITVDERRSPLVLRLLPVALHLATVPVIAKRSACVAGGIKASATNKPLAAIFGQLSLNIERYNLLRDEYPFRYRRLEHVFVRTNERDDSTVAIDTAVYDSRVQRPYRMGAVVYPDTSPSGRQRRMMFLPSFADLANPEFDDAHCFTYMGRRKGEIRIDFHPTARITTPDVDGEIYLDTATYVIRRAVFELTKPDKMDPPIVALTVTTTFRQVVPLVPILATTETVQPMRPIESRGIDPQSKQFHPFVTRTAMERDDVLGHTFIADTVGAQEKSAPPTPPPPPPVTIAVGCSMPQSFETADIPVYGILTGRPRGSLNGDRLLSGIRRQFHLPDNITLPVYGYAFDNAKLAPTLTGEVAFTLAGGHLKSIEVTATSLSSDADSLLVGSVRRADAAGAFAGATSGRYTLSLSSAKPTTDAPALDLAHIAVAVTPLARRATIDEDSPAPHLPAGKGTFEFVVDERGHAIRSTLRTVSTSSDAFAAAVSQALVILRFAPAMTGTCPVKQLVVQPFQATVHVQQQ